MPPRWLSSLCGCRRSDSHIVLASDGGSLSHATKKPKVVVSSETAKKNAQEIQHVDETRQPQRELTDEQVRSWRKKQSPKAPSKPSRKRQPKRVPSKKPNRFLVQDDDDDVDEDTKERYFKAVELLHRRIVKKSNTLTTTERQFLMDLVHQEGDSDKTTQVSNRMQPQNDDDLEERLSAIGSAIETLDKDPLFAKMPLSPLDQAKEQSGPPLVFSDDTENIDHNVVIQPKRLWTPTHPHQPHAVTPESTIPLYDEDNVEKMDTKMSAWLSPPMKDTPAIRNEKRQEANMVSDDEEYDDDGSPYVALGLDAKGGVILNAARREALRGFLPFGVSEENFWLRFRLQDGASLTALLHRIRASKHTIVCIQTEGGQVFGSFTSTHWRIHRSWFGTGEAFLFRFGDSNSHMMEVYPFTGSDDMVQYCTSSMLAVGGGDWRGDCPAHYKTEFRGIGLLVDANLEGGETNSCATFANPSLLSLPHTNEFDVASLEVWTLTPFQNVQQAEKLELHKLFVEQNMQQ